MGNVFNFQGNYETVLWSTCTVSYSLQKHVRFECLEVSHYTLVCSFPGDHEGWGNVLDIWTFIHILCEVSLQLFWSKFVFPCLFTDLVLFLIYWGYKSLQAHLHIQFLQIYDLPLHLLMMSIEEQKVFFEIIFSFIFFFCGYCFLQQKCWPTSECFIVLALKFRSLKIQVNIYKLCEGRIKVIFFHMAF